MFLFISPSGNNKYQNSTNTLGYSMIDREEFIAFNFPIFSRIIPLQPTMRSVRKKVAFSTPLFSSCILPLSPHSCSEWLFLLWELAESGICLLRNIELTQGLGSENHSLHHFILFLSFDLTPQFDVNGD